MAKSISLCLILFLSLGLQQGGSWNPGNGVDRAGSVCVKLMSDWCGFWVAWRSLVLVTVMVIYMGDDSPSRGLDLETTIFSLD